MVTRILNAFAVWVAARGGQLDLNLPPFRRRF
jgi:hypothetical protein